MSSLKWFDGDSKSAIQQMVERNCAFMLYIGKGNDEFSELFNNLDIIELLNNELIICFKLDPYSSNFKDFKDIFDNVVIPSIYLLEKNNIQQYIIKKQDSVESLKTQLYLKCQVLNAIHGTVKNILGTINAEENKQKYLQYLTDVGDKLQVLKNQSVSCVVQKVTEEDKKSQVVARIKIKIPCKDITFVQEFQTTSSLNEVKSFVLNKFNIPRGSIKFIAHRQFVDADFCQTLDALNLCPSSTIYVHMIPLDQFKPSLFSPQSWLWSLYDFAILSPYNFIQNYLKSFIRRPLIQRPRIVNQLNTTQITKKSTNKPISNIHRLRNSSDADDKKTYNGNSTQQL